MNQETNPEMLRLSGTWCVYISESNVNVGSVNALTSALNANGGATTIPSCLPLENIGDSVQRYLQIY